MSAIASFTKLPKSALPGLRKAALPIKKLFGGTRDDYHKYLRENGSNAADYKWSGWVLSTLLEYLDERFGLKLTHSEYGELADYLTNTRNCAHLILTQTHRTEFLNRLSSEHFSQDEMRNFYSEFNETTEDAGEAMTDGVDAIKTSLEAVDPDSVIVMSIG